MALSKVGLEASFRNAGRSSAAFPQCRLRSLSLLLGRGPLNVSLLRWSGLLLFRLLRLLRLFSRGPGGRCRFGLSLLSGLGLLLLRLLGLLRLLSRGPGSRCRFGLSLFSRLGLRLRLRCLCLSLRSGLGSWLLMRGGLGPLLLRRLGLRFGLRRWSGLRLLRRLGVGVACRLAAVIIRLVLSCKRRSADSEKKEQSSRTDQSDWFHKRCLQ